MTPAGPPDTVLTPARRRALLWVVFLSVLGYLLFSLWSGWREVLAAIARIGWWGVAVALALSLVNYLLRFARWQAYLAALGHRLAVPASLRIYISGFALTITPGKAGEGIRSLFLRSHGVTYPQSVAAFFAERYSDLLAVVVLAGVGISAYPAARPVLALLAAVLVASSALLLIPSWTRSATAMARRLLPAALERIIAAAESTLRYFARFFRWRLFLYGLALSLVAWAAEAVAFYYVIRFADGVVAFPVAIFIYCFAMIVGAISFLPGGLGSAEVTMIGLLVLFGVPEAQAVAITVFARFATLWFAVILGLFALPRR